MDEGAFLCNRAAIRASDAEAKHHGSDVVGVDDHRATLEALDVDIARGRHGSAQRADVVHLAISAVAATNRICSSEPTVPTSVREPRGRVW